MIYLDNSATTALSDAVRQKMCEAMETFANPSSLHMAGVAANEIVEEARGRILTTLGIRRPTAGELIFTASGTEADNLALRGTLHAKKKLGKILITDSEHSAVGATADSLTVEGYTVARIPTRGGVLDMEAFRREMTRDVLLVSLMAVNNETGAAYDIKTAFAFAKQVNPDVVTHTDAVQGYLKRKLTPQSVGADLMTLSAHKIHGPKGVGALYVHPEIYKRRKLSPIVFGGGQEYGMRSGTENVIGIAGFGQAAQDGFAHLDASIAAMCALRDEAVARLGAIPGVRVNLPAGERAPHIVSVILPDIKSETMLHNLSLHGICVSSGSACSSHSGKPSGALTAFGLSAHEADCTLRVSLSEYNTSEELAALENAMREGIDKLVRIRR